MRQEPSRRLPPKPAADGFTTMRMTSVQVAQRAEAVDGRRDGDRDIVGAAGLATGTAGKLCWNRVPQRCRSGWQGDKRPGSARCDADREQTFCGNTHQTLIVFTARWGCCRGRVSYIRATVDLRSAGRTRRWQSALAIVAVLSLFVALIAGSSLRPQLAAAALPEPAVWTHGAQGVQPHASQVQLHAAAQPVSHLDHGFSPGSTNKKPFHSMWMTRDRPTDWTDLSPHSGWLALPASFAASEFQPGGAHRAASAAAPLNGNVFTRLGILRC